jgi:hypothetical protein
MATQHIQAFLGGQLPNADGLVRAGRDQSTAIGGELQCGHVRGVALQTVDFPLRLDVPQIDVRIPEIHRGCQGFSIGGERQGIHPKHARIEGRPNLLATFESRAKTRRVGRSQISTPPRWVSPTASHRPSWDAASE